MIDLRIEKWAKILVNYSLEVKKGDLFLIRGPTLSEPLIKALLKESILKGAHPYFDLSLDGTAEIFLRYATEEQLSYISKIREVEIEEIDVILVITGGWNTRALTRQDPKRLSIMENAGNKLFQRFLKRVSCEELRWASTPYPTHSMAQEAEISLTELEELIFSSCYLYEEDPVAKWKEISKRQKGYIERLKEIDRFRIVSEGTDITFSCEGRNWINADGKNNLPDGEVFTSPLENSANGYITFTYPGLFNGREIQDIHLVFKDGKVIKARATKGKEFLDTIFKNYEGAQRIGEFAIGTNYNISVFTKNIIFDEKIGGTVHIALGNSPPGTRGKNTSSIHWDIVLDLRKGGELYGDDQLIIKDGKLLLEE